MLAGWMEIVLVGDPGGLPQTLQALRKVLIMKNISGSQKMCPPPAYLGVGPGVITNIFSGKYTCTFDNKLPTSARKKYLQLPI